MENNRLCHNCPIQDECVSQISSQKCIGRLTTRYYELMAEVCLIEAPKPTGTRAQLSSAVAALLLAKEYRYRNELDNGDIM